MRLRASRLTRGAVRLGGDPRYVGGPCVWLHHRRARDAGAPRGGDANVLRHCGANPRDDRGPRGRSDRATNRHGECWWRSRSADGHSDRDSYAFR